MKITIERILCPTDFSPESEEALRYAIALAWASERRFERAARLLQSAVPAEVLLWCEIKQVVKKGEPYREVLAYAEEQNMDLSCMGVRGAGFGLRSLFGSNTDRVLRQAPCPVLIARPRTPDGLAMGAA